MLICLDVINGLFANAGTFSVIFDAFSYALPFSSQWIHLIAKPLGILLEFIPYSPITIEHALNGGRIRE
jgi:hypothetical protein